MLKSSLEVGKLIKLSFTHPVYDPNKKSYLPDNFRFIDPEIHEVFYGGRCKGTRHKCRICGRLGSTFFQFLDIETGNEIYLSEHCLMHDSTRAWDNSTDKDIKKWYAKEDLERRAEAGDSLAGIVATFSSQEDIDRIADDMAEWWD